jgi:hypothetical protein
MHAVEGLVVRYRKQKWLPLGALLFGLAGGGGALAQSDDCPRPEALPPPDQLVIDCVPMGGGPSATRTLGYVELMPAGMPAVPTTVESVLVQRERDGMLRYQVPWTALGGMAPDQYTYTLSVCLGPVGHLLQCAPGNAVQTACITLPPFLGGAIPKLDPTQSKVPKQKSPGERLRAKVANWTSSSANDVEVTFSLSDRLEFPLVDIGGGAFQFRPGRNGFQIGGRDVPVLKVGNVTARQVDDVTVGAFDPAKDGKISGHFTRYVTQRVVLAGPVAPGEVMDLEYVRPAGMRWWLAALNWTADGVSIASTPRDWEIDLGFQVVLPLQHLWMGHILAAPVDANGKPTSNDWHFEAPNLVGAIVAGKSGNLTFTPGTPTTPAKIDVTDVNYGNLVLGPDGIKIEYLDVLNAEAAGATRVTIMRTAMGAGSYWHTLDGVQVGATQPFG